MAMIKEIAELARVSTTTVSNVIHGKTKKVSPFTIKKVEHLIKELGYVQKMVLMQNAKKCSVTLQKNINSDSGNGGYAGSYPSACRLHTTKKNQARFDFDLRFPKMPSYLRRAAIQHALGSASSYKTRLEQWKKRSRKASGRSWCGNLPYLAWKKRMS